METATAVAFVNEDLVYRPGWSFTASARDADSILVEITFPVYNSNRMLIAQGIEDRFENKVGFRIDVTDFDDEDDLTFAVLMVVLQIETHEAREFLRVRSEMYRAPFHPHRTDGQFNFADRFADTDEDKALSVINDLRYNTD